MFPNSQFMGPLFWIILGMIYSVLIYSFSRWTKNAGIQMNWWKWALSAGAYILLSMGVAGGTTLYSEGEARAGMIALIFFLIISVIAFVLLFRFVLKSK